MFLQERSYVSNSHEMTAQSSEDGNSIHTDTSETDFSVTVTFTIVQVSMTLILTVVVTLPPSPQNKTLPMMIWHKLRQSYLVIVRLLKSKHHQGITVYS